MRQAKICYHDIIEEPDRGPGAFKLEIRNPVLFKPGPATTPVDGGNEGLLPTVLQTQVAARVDKEKWQTSITDIVWSVRWQQTGLMPVRPHVLLTVPVTVGIGRAVLLK